MKAKKVNKLNILNAAMVVFSEKGFAGSAMNEIAKIADVNSSLIFYHFHSKAELWRAVKEHIANLGDNVPKAIENLDDFINFVVDERIKIYENKPIFAKMMLWQMVEDLTKTEVNTEASPSKWIDIIKDLQEREIINKNFDAKYYAQIIHGIVGSYIYDNLKILKNAADKQEYQGFIKTQITNILKN